MTLQERKDKLTKFAKDLERTYQQTLGKLQLLDELEKDKDIVIKEKKTKG